MSHHTNRSGLRKWMLALLTVTLAVSLCAGAFAFAADGDTPAMGAVTQIVGLQVNGYTLSADGYYRAGDNADGDYAFTQGMSISQAIGRITGVTVADADGNTQTLPLGSDVTVTTEATSTNGSGDSFAVSFDVAVKADGADLSAAIDVNFIAVRPYTLMLINPDWQSMVEEELTPSFDVGYFMDYFDATFALRKTDGTQGDGVDYTHLLITGTLAPSKAEIDSMLAENRNTYSTFISVSTSDSGYTIEPLKVEVTDIKYSVPTRVVRINDLVAQEARSEFKYDRATVTFEYSDGGTATLNLADVKEYFTPMYYKTNTSSATAETELTTAIKYVAFNYSIPKGDGTNVTGTTGKFRITVAQRLQDNPTVSDLNPTYAEGGAVVTISNLPKTDDTNQVDVSVSAKGAVNGTLAPSADGYTATFSQGGEYYITVSLTSGASGDYRWMTQNQGNPITEGLYTLVYTITVDNAPVEITSNFSKEVTYGDNEPAVTVTANYEGTTTQAYTTSSKVDTLPADGSQNPVFTLSYSTENGSFPTEPGTYTVTISTNKTNKFKAAETSATFTVVARKISLSATFNSPMYERGKSYTKAGLAGQLNINNIASADKDHQSAVVSIAFKDGQDSVSHAGDYTINLTINEAYKNKYAWEGESGLTGEATFTIKKRPQNVSINVGTPTFVYGTAGATPNVTCNWWGTDSAYRYAQISGPHYYKHGSSTEITDLNFSKWDVGTYDVKYTVTRGEGDNAGDYDLPTLESTFEITKAEVDKAFISNWSADSENPYNLGVYGTERSVTVGNWPLNNVAPDGTSAILISAVSGVRHDGTTQITEIADSQSGTIKLTQAGVYTVKITLNSNYKWKNEENGNAVILYAQIDKQTVNQAELTDPSAEYDGTDKTAAITFTIGNGGSAEWVLDELKATDKNIVAITDIVGSGYAAEHLAQSVTDFDNELGTFVVKYAGSYKATFELTDTDNYAWADGVTTELTYEVTQKELKVSWNYTGEYNFVAGAEKQDEPDVLAWLIADADQGLITPTFTYYDINGDEILEKKITSAGTFYKVISEIAGTDGDDLHKYAYLNYSLTVEDKDTADRKVSVEFVVKSAAFDRIELVANLGATISGNGISVVYSGSEFNFSDFVKNWGAYYWENADKTKRIDFLTVTVDAMSGNNPAISDVKMEGENVVAYNVSVTPNGDYGWSTGDDKETLTFTITVKQFEIEVDWSAATTTQTYNGQAHTVSGYKLNNAALDDNKVDVELTYTAQAGSSLTGEDVVKAGNYTVTASNLTGVRAFNYKLPATAPNAEFTIEKCKINVPAIDGNSAEFGKATVQTFTLTAPDVHNFVWGDVVSASISSKWTFDGNDYGNHPESSRSLSFVDAEGKAKLFFTHAGEYAITFALIDSDNYQWVSGANLNTTFTVSRQVVTAPKLEKQRALEYNAVDGVAQVKCPADLTAAVEFATMYGSGVIIKSADGSLEIPGSLSNTCDSKEYGLYFIKLNVSGEHRDYLWQIDPADNTSESYIRDHGALAIGYTAYSEDETSVYLYYAITKGILNIGYDMSDYTFGDNGYNGTHGHDITGKTDPVAWIKDGEFASDYAIIVANKGIETLAFYKFDSKEASQNRPGDLSGDNPRTPYADVVNGLPWEAGYYGVLITISFGEDVPYSNITLWKWFEVKKCEITIEWTGDFTVNYDGKEHTLTATVSNEIFKTETEKVEVPSLTVSLSSGSLPVNASGTPYTLQAVMNATFDGGANPNYANFVLPSANTHELRINKRTVNVYVVTGDYGSVYGIPVNYNAVSWAYKDGIGDEHKFVINNGNDVVDANTANYINYALRLNRTDAVNVSSSTPNSATYWIVPELMQSHRGNYSIEFECAAQYVVSPREITVSLNGANAESTYGDNVNVYTAYSVDWTNEVEGYGWLKIGNTTINNTSVFTLASDASNRANVGQYDVKLTQTELNKVNFKITVNGAVVGNEAVTLGQWTINKVGIKNADVSVTAVSPVIVYNALPHNIIGGLVNASVTLTNNDLNKNSVKWYYTVAADLDAALLETAVWTEVTSLTQTNVINQSYFFKVTADNHEDRVVETPCDVVISKATLKVKIDLGIYYGEKTPAEYNGTDAFKATLDELKANAEMYTVSGFCGADNIDNINLAGTFGYTTTYTQGGKAGVYGITFVNDDTLTADNYVIVNAADSQGKTMGVLTVKRLALTVAISDIQNVYYDTYADVKFVTAVTLPESTYTGVTLIKEELDEAVWNNIFDANAAYEGANIVTLKTTAYADTDSATHSKKAGEYVVSGELKSADPQNYSAVFTGSNGTTAKHVIIAATLAVNDISGYGNPYDEAEHLALIVKEDEAVTKVFAKAVDGSAVTVHFYAAAYDENATAADALDWNALTLTTDPFKYIDVCDYNVYYRITADNHNTVYGVKRVTITKVNNAFTNVDAWNYQGWTYGLFADVGSINLGGYNKDGTHKTVEPTAQFTRLVNDGVVSENVFTFVLTRNGNAIAELTGEYTTVASLYEAMWADGLFTAGTYELTISMSGTANYEALSESRTFTVEKKELLVSAAPQGITYGDDAPAEYDYYVAGFVAGKADGSLETETGILGEAKLNFFTTDYEKGRLNGSAGTYTIKHFADDGISVIEGLYAEEPENYKFTFKTSNLTVKKREITISISDAENFYHRIKLEGNVYGEEDEAEWRTGYTASNVYDGDVENEVQKVFALNTAALTSVDNHKTNNVGGYPIYAEWLTYEKDGEQISYSKNYTVKFTACSYTKNDLPDTAINQDGANCAGTYTIKQAILSVDIIGPHLNSTEGDETPAVNGSVFSNTPKYYKAKVTQGADDTVRFVMTYYKDSVSEANKLDGAPVNVGNYWVTATADNKNYIASLTQQQFTVTPAALSVKWVMDEESAKDDTAATIQYGEKIPALNGNVYPANNRFSGLAFKFSSETHFPDLSEEALIELLGTVTYGYDTGYDDNMTRRIYITPVVSVSNNFTVNAERGYLNVVARKITVRVNGYDEGNLTATSKYTGKAPFAGNTSTGITGWTVSAWLTTLEADAFVHGHSLNSLGIELSLDSRSYDASETRYGVNVSKSGDGIGGYYNVSFVVGSSNVPYGAGEGQAKPTYLITKKDLTVKVKDVTVTYGDAIDANVANGIAHGSASADLIAQYFVISGFENGESYSTLNDEIMRGNEFVFTTSYNPYVSHVGDDIELTVKNSTLKFKNYEIVNDSAYTSGKVVVVPRVIGASTHDEVYTEEVVNGNAVYNNGVYGAPREAQITFTGHDNGVGYADGYAPVFSLSYTTVNGAGQTAGAAPTKVDEYTVKVTLTNNDYVFAGNVKAHDLPFNVTKKALSPTWLHTAIENKDGETIDLTNSIADYVASIMTLSNFQKTISDNNVIDIVEGLEADQYQVGTVGSERKGLYITAQGTGEYRVRLTLTADAQDNYTFGSDGIEVTLIFNVTTDKVNITNLQITGWVYGKYDASINGVRFEVSNDNLDGVQITYALITGEIPTDKAGFQALSYSASVPVNAGNYAVRAYYPSYQGVGGDEQFVAFTVTKATLDTPVITIGAGNGTFAGVSLEATVAFDPLALRVNGFNGTSYALTEDGATLYATNAGTYTITFGIIDSVNYQWGGNASSVDWIIGKANNNVVTWNNTDEQKNLTYGNRFAPNAAATYGGTVYYNYMLKTDNTVPAADDANWVDTVSKFNVGEYWVKATCYGNDNYNTDVKIISIAVNKAVLTVTPSGSMIYGNEYQNAAFNYVITDGVVWGDGADEIIRKTGDLGYSIVDRPEKLNADTYALVLDSNENGVIGLEATNYKIVSAQGTFTVNKRGIVVNVGNMTSQYGRTVDVSDVTFGYGSINGLVPGDDLGLTFSTDATSASDVGGYIIGATYTNQNYNATINPGTYTITARLITVTIGQGGGIYGETITPVQCTKVLGDEGEDITEFVNGILTLKVVYSGSDNAGNALAEGSTAVPTNAGTYMATVKGAENNDNFIIVGEPFTTFVVEKKAVDGSLITIANQTYTGSALTPVINASAFEAAYGEDIYTELSHGDFVNAGTHAVTLKINDFANYKWQSVEIDEREVAFVIDKADNALTSETIAIAGWIYGEYDIAANAPVATVLFGQANVTYVYSSSLNGVYTSGAPVTGDVGEYYVKVTVPATDNFNAYSSEPVKFAISKKALSQPTLSKVTEGEGKNDVYTGDELLSTILGFNMALMNLNYEGKFNVNNGQVVVVAVNAGTYKVKLSISNTNNYCWQGTEDNDVELTWVIAPKAIAKPTANNRTFMVNGQVLTYIPEGFDEETMTISGNTTAYGGEFPVTVGLKDKANYVWAEGGTDDFTLTWNVIGINTVFVIVASVIGGASAVALMAVGIQFLLDHRKKRLIDRDIDKRSKAEGEPKTKNNKNNEGGND